MSRRVANVLFGCGCCDIRGRAHNTTPDSAKGYGESRGGVPFAGFAKGTGFAVPTDENRLERRYGSGHLHFITCSCFRRMPLLASPRARDKFLKILGEVCDRYDFGLFGYVVMPEHIHLLISEPNIGNPSEVMAVLKQRVSRALRGKKRKPQRGQMQFWDEPMLGRYARFWQRRFYDFNVWSARKRNEKTNYMHFNPVKRGLAASPKDWAWSSHNFYWRGEKGLCAPNPGWECKTWRRGNPVPFAKTAKGTAPTRRR